jgi:chromatin modification-related protein EAF6
MSKQQSLNKMVKSLKNTGKISDEMEELINKKIQLEQDLANLERQIYNLETSYLENSSPMGNLVQGWNETPSRSTANSQRKQVVDEDRLFSLSSATSVNNTPLGQKQDLDAPVTRPHKQIKLSKKKTKNPKASSVSEDDAMQEDSLEAYE